MNGGDNGPFYDVRGKFVLPSDTEMSEKAARVEMIELLGLSAVDFSIDDTPLKSVLPKYVKLSVVCRLTVMCGSW